MNDRVFHEVPQNRADLKTKIRRTVPSITEETLQKLFQNIRNRLSFVFQRNGVVLKLFFRLVQAYEYKLYYSF